MSAPWGRKTILRAWRSTELTTPVGGRSLGTPPAKADTAEKVTSKPAAKAALKRLVSHIAAEASQLQLGLLERRDDVLFTTQYKNLKGEPGYRESQA